MKTVDIIKPIEIFEGSSERAEKLKAQMKATAKEYPVSTKKQPSDKDSESEARKKEKQEKWEAYLKTPEGKAELEKTNKSWVSYGNK